MLLDVDVGRSKAARGDAMASHPGLPATDRGYGEKGITTQFGVSFSALALLRFRIEILRNIGFMTSFFFQK